jgi:hypothetical protein
MSDISLIECIYNQLKSIRNNKMSFEKASSIINTAYIVLEKAIETQDNSMYLKKTRKILGEIDDIYLSPMNEGLEDAIDINTNYADTNYARATLKNALPQEIFN